MTITTKYSIGSRVFLLSGWQDGTIRDDKIDTIYTTVNSDGTIVTSYLLDSGKGIMGTKPTYREKQLFSSREELIQSL